MKSPRSDRFPHKRRLPAQAALAESEALAEISRRISASLDLDQILQIVVESAHRLVMADMTYIGLPDSLGALRIVALIGNRSEAFRGLVIPSGAGVGGRVMVSGRPFQAIDYGEDAAIVHDQQVDRAVADEEIRSGLALPILLGTETVGVFWVTARVLRRFTEGEIALLERLAALAAVAMENARRLLGEREARAESEALLAATASLGIQAEPADVLRTLVQQAALLLDADSATYGLGSRRQIRVPGHWTNGDWRDDAHTIPLRGSIVGLVWRSRRPYRTNDLANDPHSNHAIDQDHGLHSQLAVPLLGSDGERFGVISVANSRRSAGFGERDERLLTAFCQYATAVLRRAQDMAARLEAEREAARRRQEVEALLSAAERLNAAAAPDEILRRVVEVATESFRVEHVTIATNEGDHALVRHAWIDGVWSADPVRIPLKGSINGWVIDQRQPYQSHNVAADPLLCASVPGRHPRKTMLSVPIIGREGVVLGVLNLHNRRDGQPFSDDDLRLAEGIAHHAAVSLERTSLTAELRRGEERYRDLVEHASDIIYSIGLDGRFRFCNESAARIMRRPVERILGLHYLELVRPDYREKVKAFYHQQYLNKTPATYYEFPTISGDGAELWIGQNVSMMSENGQVTGFEAVARDVTERRALEGQLRRQAFSDALTGLANRALFIERLGHALVTSSRRSTDIAVFFLDLDGFKLVNDSLGHVTGDALLVAVAQRLAAAQREGDTLARFGGDEFAILIEDIPSAQVALQIAEQVIAAVRRPFALGGRELFISASVGYATCCGGSQQSSPEDLLREADTALYQAKAGGKSRAVRFNARMSAAAVERLTLETDLRHAIARGELRLHYQPEVDLHSGKIIGVEALVRWAHPREGLIAPERFIGLAEETGLIRQIGQWVQREACRQARAWQVANPCRQPLVMSVNLSAREFQQPDLVQQIQKTLEAAEIEPSALKLEITESLVLQTGEATIATLTALKQLGVRLAIDDFGTGYSSLSYLQRFPIDSLKVDRSFVSRLDQDSGTVAILRAIAALAHALGLDLTAEGIETKAQLATVRAIGCDVGQGYYFARPSPAEEIEQIFAGHTRWFEPNHLCRPAPSEVSVSRGGSWESALEDSGRRRLPRSRHHRR